MAQRLIGGEAFGPVDGCLKAGEHCRREAMSRGIDPEPARKALLVVWEYFQAARAGSKFVDGALIEFLRVLLDALSESAGLTIHVRLLHGEDTEHVLDAIAKALGLALGEACATPG